MWSVKNVQYYQIHSFWVFSRITFSDTFTNSVRFGQVSVDFFSSCVKVFARDLGFDTIYNFHSTANGDNIERGLVATLLVTILRVLLFTWLKFRSQISIENYCNNISNNCKFRISIVRFSRTTYHSTCNRAFFARESSCRHAHNVLVHCSHFQFQWKYKLNVPHRRTGQSL